MVTFQCDNCAASLKKKQVQNHYMTQCRSCHSFSCLSCWKVFDRQTIVAHTSCVTEEELYQKGCNTKPKKFVPPQNNHTGSTEIPDCSDLEWKGVRKTSRNILKKVEAKKTDIDDLAKTLIEIYAKHMSVSTDEVDEKVLKEKLMNRLESDRKFGLDLRRNLVKLNNI